MNIDEAQDFAPTELKLLKAALGNRVVFNLYGDVNQAIYEYKGIMDWSDLQELTSNSVYHLNENYRNTLEITDYCNTEFEADVTAVGLSGAPVRQLAIEKACAALNSLHSANPSMRCAVIYKRGVEGLLEELIPLLPSIHVGYLSNNTTAISCLTVEECKGLEFDAALVVTNEMSVNEKYIAFTRALDHLILTSSKKAFFSGDDNAIPEDVPDDELTESTPISIVANVEDEQETEQESVGNQADPSVELPKQPIDISIKDSTPYIRAFFSEDLRLVDAFNELVHHIQQADSSVMIRAKDEYIGFARKGERCIMYVSRKGANFFVKFIHLYSPEKLEGEKISQYHRLLDQALNYSKQFSVKLK